MFLTHNFAIMIFIALKEEWLTVSPQLFFTTNISLDKICIEYFFGNNDYMI